MLTVLNQYWQKFLIAFLLGISAFAWVLDFQILVIVATIILCSSGCAMAIRMWLYSYRFAKTFPVNRNVNRIKYGPSVVFAYLAINVPPLIVVFLLAQILGISSGIEESDEYIFPVLAAWIFTYFFVSEPLFKKAIQESANNAL